MIVMIKCVCLVVELDDKLLLVQARNRKKYYFPGGKIDQGESLKQALRRELQEELQLDISEQNFNYLGTIVGDAYPQKNTKTELNCFSTSLDIDWSSVKPAQEITDIKWISKNETEKIAPAVLTWIKYAKQKIESSKAVKSRPYHVSLYADLVNFTLSAEDREFTKTPLENIDLANRDQERHSTLVYDDKGQCVGFFTLHEGDGVKPYSANAIFFRSFSVDSHYRGFGFGKKVMRVLPQYVKQYYPTINEIYLAVNTDNHLARELYIQSDYEIVGETLLENKPVYIMKQSC